MTKENAHSAIKSNSPFVISMADGQEYLVPQRDFIAFTGKGTAVVVTVEDDRVHVLPFITITGISQNAAVNGN